MRRNRENTKILTCLIKSVIAKFLVILPIPRFLRAASSLRILSAVVEGAVFSSSTQVSKEGCSNIQVTKAFIVCAVTSPELRVSNIAFKMRLNEKPISNKGPAIGGGGGEFDRLQTDQRSSSDSEVENRRLLLDCVEGTVPKKIMEINQHWIYHLLNNKFCSSSCKRIQLRVLRSSIDQITHQFCICHRLVSRYYFSSA